jgi:hypothetical protein
MIDATYGPLIAASVALLAAAMSLWIGVINWRQTRRSYTSSKEARIEGLYDRLMDYRLKHPEVFRLSRLWKAECLSKIYSQVDQDEKLWAFYFGYVELCISYCNATLQAKKNGEIADNLYRTQYEPLMKLLITEHFPIISQLIREGKFISGAISEFVARTRKRGWNWEREHDNLDKIM